MNEWIWYGDRVQRERREMFTRSGKTPKGKGQLGRLGRGWNETTELHLGGKGVRLLNGLIWCWMWSSALLNKITKYTNQITLRSRALIENISFSFIQETPLSYGT
jgi:hypothetical protein